MQENIFIIRKNKLKSQLEAILKEANNDKESILVILDILNQYSFENKHLKKGALTRFVIDSAIIDYSVGEKIIEFDNSIR